MNPPTDSQQQAIGARGNVLVVAGAGTGKTSTLVQRCLALLAAGGSLENLLLVTFTEAAAAEMKGRIREALQQQRAAAEDRLREHFDKQLALLDIAHIATLHSFCLQLVREHFYELGIDPELIVLDEQQTRPLIQQLLDALFNRHYAGETAASAAVRALIRRQGRGSDENIRRLMLKLHRYAQSLARPDAWLKSQQNLYEQATPVRWREWLQQSFGDWRELWLPLLQKHSGTPAVDLSLAALRSVPEPFSFDAVSRALQSVRAADETDANWPRGSVGKVRNHVKGFFEEADFLASLTPVDGLDPLAEDWEFVRHDMVALLQVTREFTADFTRSKREFGGVDFADLEQLALRVLRDAQTGEPTPAAEQWRRQFQFVFVDEYQDINAAQDAILSALSREGAAANRFLVGDVKQSIYRFRLADPAIFRGYEQQWSAGDPDSRRISLAENFRSRPGILDFINPLFGSLMRESIGGLSYEELNFGDPAGRAVLRTAEDSVRVEFHLITKAEDAGGEPEAGGEENGPESDVADLLATEREARLVALRLWELKREGHQIWDKATGEFRSVDWADMAVLLRSPTARVEAFAKEFARLGVPLEAARGGFYLSVEISDLVSLLKLLDNPLQDLPLLAVLRSPLVGLSSQELAEVRATEDPQNRIRRYWLAARRFCQAGGQGSPVAGKLKIFFDRLDRWRELIRQTSLSHCLETALAETHYEMLLRAGSRGEQQWANVRRLLDLAREYDPYQRQGLFRFLRFVKAQEEMEVESEPSPETGNAVRLMSIHRSKGLEFPVVVVAGLGWQFNVRDLQETILVDEHYGLCPKVTPEEGRQQYPSLPYWLARRRQRRELLGEELRLLYVAMTRARDTLLLTGTSASRTSPKWDLAENPALSDQEVLAARSYLDWLTLWLPLAVGDGEWASDFEGQSRLLRWKIYRENDPQLKLAEPGAGTTGELDPVVDPVAAPLVISPGIRQRIAWNYPFAAAARQKAKATVTELRRHQADEEAQPARFIRSNRFTFTRSSTAERSVRSKLAAAEIGVAHHRFLQKVSLAKVGAVEELREEARRLRKENWLSEAEMAALNFPGLAQFWHSEIGWKIAEHAASVRRELQFTAGFTAIDLVESKLEPPPDLPLDEFVVVQGMVDLAVMLPEEIWVVDFKTDAIGENGLEAKVKQYEPQLRLYALALARIYAKPVTRCLLYFLEPQVLVSVKLRAQTTRQIQKEIQDRD